MFLIAGIQNKVRECGTLSDAACPVCGRVGALHVTTQYMTPHIFFIPTFRFHRRYLATCGACASLMDLAVDKGRALERGEPVEPSPEDLQVLQNNAAPACPRCGERLPHGSAFCNRCGERL